MNIQWCSGHMTKAKRVMEEDIKLIGLVIELMDARVPLSGYNPDIDSLAAGRTRTVLLNESDLADECLDTQRAAWFEAKGIRVIKIGVRNKGTLKQAQGVVQQACRDKIERDRKWGTLNCPTHTIVVGVPNVGKSTFINSFAGKACTRTGNKSGVTKGNQWIRLNKTLKLLNTPDILWPRSNDQNVGLRLTLVGSINDRILNKDGLAGRCIRILEEQYPGALLRRSDPETEGKGPAVILEDIARARSCLMKGEELDTARTLTLLLDDLRVGKLGHVTLEQPGE